MPPQTSFNRASFRPPSLTPSFGLGFREAQQETTFTEDALGFVEDVFNWLGDLTLHPVNNLLLGGINLFEGNFARAGQRIESLGKNILSAATFSPFTGFDELLGVEIDKEDRPFGTEVLKELGMPRNPFDFLGPSIGPGEGAVGGALAGLVSAGGNPLGALIGGVIGAGLGFTEPTQREFAGLILDTFTAGVKGKARAVGVVSGISAKAQRGVRATIIPNLQHLVGVKPSFLITKTGWRVFAGATRAGAILEPLGIVRAAIGSVDRPLVQVLKGTVGPEVSRVPGFFERVGEEGLAGLREGFGIGQRQGGVIPLFQKLLVPVPGSARARTAIANQLNAGPEGVRRVFLDSFMRSMQQQGRRMGEGVYEEFATQFAAVMDTISYQGGVTKALEIVRLAQKGDDVALAQMRQSLQFVDDADIPKALARLEATLHDIDRLIPADEGLKIIIARGENAAAIEESRAALAVGERASQRVHDPEAVAQGVVPNLTPTDFLPAGRGTQAQRAANARSLAEQDVLARTNAELAAQGDLLAPALFSDEVRDQLLKSRDAGWFQSALEEATTKAAFTAMRQQDAASQTEIYEALRRVFNKRSRGVEAVGKIDEKTGSEFWHYATDRDFRDGNYAVIRENMIERSTSRALRPVTLTHREFIEFAKNLDEHGAGTALADLRGILTRRRDSAIQAFESLSVKVGIKKPFTFGDDARSALAEWERDLADIATETQKLDDILGVLNRDPFEEAAGTFTRAELIEQGNRAVQTQQSRQSFQVAVAKLAEIGDLDDSFTREAINLIETHRAVNQHIPEALAESASLSMDYAQSLVRNGYQEIGAIRAGRVAYFNKLAPKPLSEYVDSLDIEDRQVARALKEGDQPWSVYQKMLDDQNVDLTSMHTGGEFLQALAHMEAEGGRHSTRRLAANAMLESFSRNSEVFTEAFHKGYQRDFYLTMREQLVQPWDDFRQLPQQQELPAVFRDVTEFGEGALPKGWVSAEGVANGVGRSLPKEAKDALKKIVMPEELVAPLTNMTRFFAMSAPEVSAFGQAVDRITTFVRATTLLLTGRVVRDFVGNGIWTNQMMGVPIQSPNGLRAYREAATTMLAMGVSPTDAKSPALVRWLLRPVARGIGHATVPRRGRVQQVFKRADGSEVVNPLTAKPYSEGEMFIAYKASAGQMDRQKADYLGALERAKNEEIGPIRRLALAAARQIHGATVYQEHLNRYTAFRHLVSEGDDLATAARKVRTAYYDPAMFQTGADAFMRRAVFFWTWTRHNVPLQMRFLSSRPSRGSQIVAARHAIEGELARDDDTYMSGFLQKGGALRIRRNGDRHDYFLLDNFLPVWDAARILEAATGGPEGLAAEAVNQLAPIWRTPFELAGNIDFRRTELRGPNAEPAQLQEFEGQRRRFLGASISPRLRHTLKSNLPVLGVINRSQVEAFAGADMAGRRPQEHERIFGTRTGDIFGIKTIQGQTREEEERYAESARKRNVGRLRRLYRQRIRLRDEGIIDPQLADEQIATLVQLLSELGATPTR